MGEVCRRGIVHLSGPWLDGLLTCSKKQPIDFAELLERLHLRAALLHVNQGALQRAREHYCYAADISTGKLSSNLSYLARRRRHSADALTAPRLSACGCADHTGAAGWRRAKSPQAAENEELT